MHRYAETLKSFPAHSSLFPIMGIKTTLAIQHFKNRTRVGVITEFHHNYFWVLFALSLPFHQTDRMGPPLRHFSLVNW